MKRASNMAALYGHGRTRTADFTDVNRALLICPIPWLGGASMKRKRRSC